MANQGLESVASSLRLLDVLLEYVAGGLGLGNLAFRAQSWTEVLCLENRWAWICLLSAGIFSTGVSRDSGNRLEGYGAGGFQNYLPLQSVPPTRCGKHPIAVLAS